MIAFTLIFLLIIVAGISKSIMDTVDFHFKDSIFDDIKSEKLRSWFNESEGWKNKYKDRDISKGPAFFGSTTFFVFVTDSWHFFQFIMLTSLFISITLALSIYVSLSCYYWILLFFGLKGLMTGVFELFWKNIWKK